MIRVASYNMRKAIGIDRRRRPERTLEVLNELGADVVALQEADRRFGARVAALPPQLIEQHSDLVPVALDAREGSLGWHGNALLVRKSVQVVDHGLVHLPSLEPRGAVTAELEVDGCRLRVIGMHLDLSGLWRRRQAHAVLSHLGEAGDTPTVLMGDLNEWSARRLPTRFRAPLRLRRYRAQLPRAPAGGRARPDHGQRSAARAGRRRARERGGPQGQRSPAGLGRSRAVRAARAGCRAAPAARGGAARHAARASAAASAWSALTGPRAAHHPMRAYA